MSPSFITSKEIKTADLGGATDLLCPRCGADYLHHKAVTTYDRGEDAGTVVETRVEGANIAIDTTSPGIDNPSRRRDGLVIEFTCECCGDAPIQLCIGQHKGATEIGWRFDPTRADQS